MTSESWYTSGELYARSGINIQDQNNEWHSLISLYQNLLNAGLSKDEINVQMSQDNAGIEQAISVNKSLKQYRMDFFKSIDIDEKMNLIIQKLQMDLYDTLIQGESRMSILETNLTTCLVHYAASIEKEIKLVSNIMMKADSIYERDMEVLDHELEMEVFGTYLAHETGHQVSVARLASDNPQYIRCKRATIENVKEDFFSSSESLSSGIEVLDVYRVENKPMLRKFQNLAGNPNAGKVRGMFCVVPPNCIEKLIVQGMFPDEKFDLEVFRPTIPGEHVSNGYAWQKHRRALKCPFPNSFSRYSTLESDRQAVSSLDCIEKPRFLILNRVLINDQVVSRGDAFENASHKHRGDAIYDTESEEYILLNPNSVLPEFIIRYRFMPKDQESEFANMFELEPDFSTHDVAPIPMTPASWVTRSTFNCTPEPLRSEHPDKRSMHAAELQVGIQKIHANAQAQQEALVEKTLQLFDEFVIL